MLKNEIEQYRNDTIKKFSHPWRRVSILTETWEKCRKRKHSLEISANLIFFMNYWVLTNQMDIDLTTSKAYGKKAFTEIQLLNIFKEKHSF